jgi:hypothetical protein
LDAFFFLSVRFLFHSLLFLQTEEKQLTRHIDAVTKLRSSLPMYEIEDYTFQTLEGKSTKLSELFGDKSELVVQHLMWTPGVRSFLRSFLVLSPLPSLHLSLHPNEVLVLFGFLLFAEGKALPCLLLLARCLLGLLSSDHWAL